MEGNIPLFLVLIPALPLAASLVCAVFGPRLLKQFSHVPVIAAIVGSCVCSLLLLYEVRYAQNQQNPATVAEARGGFERTVTLWTWAAVDNAFVHSGQSPLSTSDGGSHSFRIDVTLRADALTAMMLAMVTFVSSLIAIYSAGYMHSDRGYWRFFAYIALFVFSMTMLVSVSNFVLLYVFWEAVGVCSYLLIGFWYQKPEAAAAGKKAFLVNRIGDLGFALALFLIWTTYGTLNFHDTQAGSRLASADAAVASEATDNATDAARPERGVLGKSRIAANDYVGGKVGTAICLLLLLGACGKSAQFPLHVWLPDAMEGPTPVSALIHAATMVTAGVYMVARCTPLFMVSPFAQLIVACIGGFTALLAALIALTQYDLKRVLAYSTISQLGYMFLGLGAGSFAGITAGMFHLFTHAFFKALLFLGAGSVMHAMGNVIDMRRFGGLRKLMPITHATFFIGCLALAGIPPFAGFWSKDAIVAAVEEKAHELTHGLDSHHVEDEGAHAHGPTDASFVRQSAFVYRILYGAAILTAFLTAFYTFRAFFLTFYGPQRVPREAGDHAHESPPVMWWPLVILALGAVLAGLCFDRTYIGTNATHIFAEFLAHTPSLADGAVAATKVPYQFHVSVAGASIAVAFAGLLLTTYFYVGDRREIGWVKSILSLDGLSRWFDGRVEERWRNQPFIAGVHRTARNIGLGWLTAGLGYLLHFVVLVLAAPLLILSYVPPYKLSFRKFYFDEIYQLVVVFPARVLASVCYAVDRWIIDGLVNLLGRIPLAVGSLMRTLQMGLVQFYALAMVLGVLVLIATKWLMGTG